MSVKKRVKKASEFLGKLTAVAIILKWIEVPYIIDVHWGLILAPVLTLYMFDKELVVAFKSMSWSKSDGQKKDKCQDSQTKKEA